MQTKRPQTTSGPWWDDQGPVSLQTTKNARRILHESSERYYRDVHEYRSEAAQEAAFSGTPTRAGIGSGSSGQATSGERGTDPSSSAPRERGTSREEAERVVPFARPASGASRNKARVE